MNQRITSMPNSFKANKDWNPMQSKIGTTSSKLWPRPRKKTADRINKLRISNHSIAWSLLIWTTMKMQVTQKKTRTRSWTSKKKWIMYWKRKKILSLLICSLSKRMQTSSQKRENSYHMCKRQMTMISITTLTSVSKLSIENCKYIRCSERK
jgi:hypothetical protein